MKKTDSNEPVLPNEFSQKQKNIARVRDLFFSTFRQKFLNDPNEKYEAMDILIGGEVTLDDLGIDQTTLGVNVNIKELLYYRPIDGIENTEDENPVVLLALRIQRQIRVQRIKEFFNPDCYNDICEGMRYLLNGSISIEDLGITPAKKGIYDYILSLLRFENSQGEIRHGAYLIHTAQTRPLTRQDAGMTQEEFKALI